MKTTMIHCVPLAACLVLAAAGGLPAIAQDAAGAVDASAAPAEADEPIRQEMSIQDVVRTGGAPMYVLGVMSIIGLALVFYFFVVLRESQVMPKKLILEMRRLLSAGREEDAIRLCESDRSAAAAVALVAINHARVPEQSSPQLLKEVIEGEGGRQATMIQSQIQYLQDIAAIAPMIGLLGTVLGMLKAFNTVALDIAKAKPMVLAGGVSQALITTAAGLIVGIPAMIAYAYFRGRTAKLISALEVAAADLLTLVLRKRSP
jgi:biopolymer transport protein ExbB